MAGLGSFLYWRATQGTGGEELFWSEKKKKMKLKMRVNEERGRGGWRVSVGGDTALANIMLPHCTQAGLGAEWGPTVRWGGQTWGIQKVQSEPAGDGVKDKATERVTLRSMPWHGSRAHQSVRWDRGR